ncbi:MAG TPA: hypothetical protein QGF05_03510, partial [Dehalococcoidia bacterium]|nr:hypothetical protein [Dehalococcoidia bacterium]
MTIPDRNFLTGSDGVRHSFAFSAFPKVSQPKPSVIVAMYLRAASSQVSVIVVLLQAQGTGDCREGSDRSRELH